MSMLAVNGIRLAYDIIGDVGPPLVLTHGSWGDRRNWASVIPGLSLTFRVVTWDRRGHGGSDDGAGQGTREQDSDDLAGLIEALGLVPVHGVGNSFGGSITLGLAARRPEVFASICVHEPPVFDVLADTGSSELALVRDRIRRVTERLAEGELSEGAALFVDNVVGQAGSWESFSADARGSMQRHAGTFLDENRDPDVFALDLAALSRFERPALMSFGDASPAYFGEVVKRVAGVIPNARIHTFEGAGHVPHRSHPAAFVDAVKDFVQEST